MTSHYCYLSFSFFKNLAGFCAYIISCQVQCFFSRLTTLKSMKWSKECHKHYKHRYMLTTWYICTSSLSVYVVYNTCLHVHCNSFACIKASILGLCTLFTIPARMYIVTHSPVLSVYTVNNTRTHVQYVGAPCYNIPPLQYHVFFGFSSLSHSYGYRKLVDLNHCCHACSNRFRFIRAANS